MSVAFVCKSLSVAIFSSSILRAATVRTLLLSRRESNDTAIPGVTVPRRFPYIQQFPLSDDDTVSYDVFLNKKSSTRAASGGVRSDAQFWTPPNQIPARQTYDFLVQNDPQLPQLLMKFGVTIPARNDAPYDLLYIDDSKLVSGAGLGLFARGSLPAKTFLGAYSLDDQSRRDYIKNHPEEQFNNEYRWASRTWDAGKYNDAPQCVYEGTCKETCPLCLVQGARTKREWESINTVL